MTTVNNKFAKQGKISLILARLEHMIWNDHHHFILTSLQEQGFVKHNTVKARCAFCPGVFNFKLNDDDIGMDIWDDSGKKHGKTQ